MVFFDFEKSFIYFSLKAKDQILPLYIYYELSFFKKSIVYIGNIIPYKKIEEINDLENAATYVQSKIMEYSLKIE